MYTSYLIHYNHNHDRLGRFARSVGSAGSTVGSAAMPKSKKKQQPPKADIKKGKAANTKLSDKERKRIVDSGDAKEVAKYKDRLSTRELETAVNRLQREKLQRIDLEKKLTDLNSDGRDANRKTIIDKVEKYGNDLERLSNGVEKAAKMYNTAAKVHNLMSPASDQWPIFGEKKKGEKEKTEAQRLRDERGEKVKERNLRKAEIDSVLNERKALDAVRDYERERTTKAYQEKQDNKNSKAVEDNKRSAEYAKSQLEREQAEDDLRDYRKTREDKRIADIPIQVYDPDYYYDEEKRRIRHSDFVEKGENFLAHYNHNHDKLGRFARSNGSGSSTFNTRKLEKCY